MTQIKEALPLLAVLAAIVVLAWVLSRGSRTFIEKTSRQQLLRLCLGDRELMKRLLEREVALHPGISRREAVARAIDSLRRDSSSPRLKGLEEMPASPTTWRQRFYRLRSIWRRTSLSTYVEYSFKFALVLLVFYGLAKLLGFDALTKGRGFQ